MIKTRFKHEEIAKAREEKNITQKQLAEKLGVLDIVLQSWEYGKQKPNGNNLTKLMQELDLSESDMLEIIDDSDNHILSFDGKKLSALRQNKGLSQRQLAKKMNVHFQTVNRWENNVSIPTFNNQNRLANILDCSINDFNLKGKRL